MPRGKKKTVKVETVEAIEPVVNEAEVTEAEVKTTVEVTANPESTEPENVTITRDENGEGEIISIQPTQELIDQQNAEVEKEEEKTEEEETKTEEEEEKMPESENVEANLIEWAVDENLDEDKTEVPAEAETPAQEESTTEPLTPAANSRWIASQIITNPYGRRSVGYQPNPSKAVFTKADNQWNASVTVFGRRGEERIKRDWTSL